MVPPAPIDSPPRAIVAFTGPSGSGKSTLAETFQALWGRDFCTLLPLDRYYHDLSRLSPSDRADLNFDQPGALDLEAALADLQQWQQGGAIDLPSYDFVQHTRSPLTTYLKPTPLLLVEGLFPLHLAAMREIFTAALFLDLPAEECLRRRLKRDTSERGRSEAEVKERFEKQVQPAREAYIDPQKAHASLVLDARSDREILLRETLGHLRQRLPHIAFPQAEKLPAPFTALAARLGRERLGQRLERQSSHWAKLSHQAEGILSIERYIPLDRTVGKLLKYSGLGILGRRNARRLKVEKHGVKLPPVAHSLEGFTVLQLSDLHLDLETGVLEALRETLPTLSYDLAVITGDYRNSTSADYHHALDLTREVTSLLQGPLLGILGNHDFIEMVPGLEAGGLPILLNEGRVFHYRGKKIWIAGTDDPHFYQTHELKQLEPPPGLKPDFRLLLTHSPCVYREAADQRNFDLMLCGHTHGGQICLPGGIPIVRNGRCPKDLLSGPWKIDQLQGYTSRGTGCCGVPARFFCSPEITLHTFKT